MENLRLMIVSLPGTWQRMLQKCIERYPFVQVVDIANGSLSAAQRAKKYQPDLMLVDSSIPFDDVIVLIRNVKTDHPNTRSIVITDTTDQKRRILRAGAEYTLSSYNFESQMSEVFDQLKGTLAADIES